MAETNLLSARKGRAKNEGDSDGTEEGKGDSCGGNGEGVAATTTDGGEVKFETNEEEEEEEANTSHRFKNGDAPLGENIVEILPVSSKCRWSQQNSTEDFRDDFGLSKWFKEEGEESGEKYNQNGLENEKREGIIERIVSLPYAIGAGLDGCHVNDGHD